MSPSSAPATNVDTPVSILYHRARFLERLSIQLSTGPFINTNPVRLQDQKPCSTCISTPNQDICTSCRENYLSTHEEPLEFQRLQYFFLFALYSAAGWGMVLGNMVFGWWKPGAYLHKILDLTSLLLLPTSTLESIHTLISQPTPLTRLVVGTLSLLSILVLSLTALHDLLEYKWSSTLERIARTRRSDRKLTMRCPVVGICLCLLSTGVGLYIICVDCGGRESWMVVGPWMRSAMYFVMGVFTKRGALEGVEGVEEQVADLEGGWKEGDVQAGKGA
ncbi:hypothetical protein VTL71DRAFT_7619 [Oculimacula yallundae]|uniref:Uncharacterized protein n=1 Tax=Oculimacula yallundae TaxID=86028 RepID=A0ABR4BUQ6_9HELO